jgi:hypothetical protein
MKKQDREDMEQCEKWFKKHWMKHGKCDSGHSSADGASGAVYGLGFIGALIFFIGNATTFWGGVLGILQAIVWPAYVVYEVLNYFIK